MEKRIGRPPTGKTPNITIRLDREAYRRARIAAVIEGKTVGEWLAEAINEKLVQEALEGKESGHEE